MLIDVACFNAGTCGILVVSACFICCCDLFCCLVAVCCWFCVVSFNSVGIVLFFVFMSPRDAACLVG